MSLRGDEPSVGDRAQHHDEWETGRNLQAAPLVSTEYRPFSSRRQVQVGGADRIERRHDLMEADHAFRNLWANRCEFSAIVGIQQTTAAGRRRREIGKSEIPE